MRIPPAALFFSRIISLLTALVFRLEAGQQLSEAQVDRALDAIWQKTPSEEKRSADFTKRAALEAYLQKLGPGTTVVAGVDALEPQKESDFPPLHFHSELLPGNTGYIRMGSFLSNLPDKLDPVLRDFSQTGARNLILDLRATPPQGTLDLVAGIAGCFLPAATPLFTQRESDGSSEVVQTKRSAVARFRTVVLTGSRTGGPVEVLAAVLRASGGATIIGVSTQGRAADFDVVPLGGGAFLRLPVREASVAGAPGLFPDGVHPDIVCSATPEAVDTALLRAAKEGRVAPLLKQTPRTRLNEAALVAGENPEMEAWIQSQMTKGKERTEPVPRDAALFLAMDFLTAWDSLFGKADALP